MIICSELGKVATSEAGGITLEPLMCVCFYVSCSDCVGVCWNVCCVVAVVKDGGFLALEC